MPKFIHITSDNGDLTEGVDDSTLEGPAVPGEGSDSEGKDSVDRVRKCIRSCAHQEVCVLIFVQYLNKCLL